MDCPRPYSFRIIVFSSVFLAAGFLAGAKLAEAGFFVRRPTAQRFAGNSIMLKRAQAIQASKQSGKNTYSFDVFGFYPVLASQQGGGG